MLTRMAAQIFELNYYLPDLLVIAIQPRGITVARRLIEILESKFGTKIQLHSIDPSFFRDDISTHSGIIIPSPTEISDDIENKNLLLIDDIIFTGRTLRSAIEAILQVARPKSIKTMFLINRHLEREIPVSVDYEGVKLTVNHSEKLKTILTESNQLAVQFYRA